VGLTDADGKDLCSARPAPALPGVGALEWFHELVSAGGFSVGFDFKVGLSAEPSIVLVQPVSPGSGGKPAERRYVFAVMQLDWLNELAENSRLPPGWAISVTNSKGDAVARYPDPEKWVGKSRQSPDGLETMRASEGTRVTSGIDGVKRLYAYAKVGHKGDMIVNVGVSREAILAPAKRALRNQLTALGIVGILAILAAWFGADVFLLKQVRILIDATKRLATGDLAARSGLSYQSGELGELAKAFDEMAETLEWRNAQLKESEIERSDPLAKLPEFIACVPEPFLLLDGNLAIIACNPEACELFGIRRSELLGIYFPALCPGIPVEEFSPWLAADETDPSAPRVRRLRARTRLKPEAVNPLPVDVSIAKINLPQGMYALALLIRARETGTAS
jgi:PAS domain-containing protein